MGGRDISTNKAARLLLQSMAAGEELSEYAGDDGERLFFIGYSTETYHWGAVRPLFDEGFIEKEDRRYDALESFVRSFGDLCGFIGVYVLTDAGLAYVAKRFPQKAA